jgi:hypothetical protein
MSERRHSGSDAGIELYPSAAGVLLQLLRDDHRRQQANGGLLLGDDWYVVADPEVVARHPRHTQLPADTG